MREVGTYGPMKTKLTLVSVEINGRLASMFLELPVGDDGRVRVPVDALVQQQFGDVRRGTTVTTG